MNDDRERGRHDEPEQHGGGSANEDGAALFARDQRVGAQGTDTVELDRRELEATGTTDPADQTGDTDAVVLRPDRFVAGEQGGLDCRGGFRSGGTGGVSLRLYGRASSDLGFLSLRKPGEKRVAVHGGPSELRVDRLAFHQHFELEILELVAAAAKRHEVGLECLELPGGRDRATEQRPISRGDLRVDVVQLRLEGRLALAECGLLHPDRRFGALQVAPSSSERDQVIALPAQPPRETLTIHK